MSLCLVIKPAQHNYSWQGNKNNQEEFDRLRFFIKEN